MTQDPILECKDKVMPVVQQAQELQVTDAITEEHAAGILAVIKTLQKEVGFRFGISLGRQ